ncbi:Glucanosyltransferase-domain-containing protein [Halteromyces radiatus]|uniref:Glucanosyltransferase-domain-containing protein n=1 Tax=Halteromyces radiatus TaxID=101107 RepID=UPI00221EA745|nr:Glucanosyltransferase-domain-containing protein [Halteromyces radiatus]KAI8076891.1 Glucanosyltransferase-domain-containing protein [Halteromyces radiatus]
MYRYLSLLSLIWLQTASVTALNPIVIKGQKFFDSITKEQFFIKGVAYQPRGDGQVINDPLADEAGCARDAPLMKELGANVVRVYEVDPTKDHDACMKSFADNGLYLVLDIATPKYSINRKRPEYDVTLYNAYRATVSSFAKYPHLLAFVAGNEVTNDRTNTPASAYVRAVIRDMKNFLRHGGSRAIPVGYASNDDEHIRDSIKDYFVCGDDEESHADFFGINLYEWCGGSSFEKSGYAERTKEFESYGKPVFLSEYGCNLVRPRTFGEVSAVYGPQMTPVFSGGIVYEWTQENNEYGLVKIANSQVETLTDYHNLQKVLKATNPKGIKMDDYQQQQQQETVPCPGRTEDWKASTELPPTPSEGACSCMKDNLSCIASDAVHQSNKNSTLGTQLDTMCGMVNCGDISGEGESGKYGAFSFCNPEDKLSYLYNLYVTQSKNEKSFTSATCDFNGYAQSVTPKRNDLNDCTSIKPNLDGLPKATFNLANSPISASTLLLIFTFILHLAWA